MKKSKWNIKPTKVTPIKIIPVLNKKFDIDNDGVPDWKDCKPFNPKKHRMRKDTRHTLAGQPFYVSDETEGEVYRFPSKEARTKAPIASGIMENVFSKYPSIATEIERAEPQRVEYRRVVGYPKDVFITGGKEEPQVITGYEDRKIFVSGTKQMPPMTEVETPEMAFKLHGIVAHGNEYPVDDSKLNEYIKAREDRERKRAEIQEQALMEKPYSRPDTRGIAEGFLRGVYMQKEGKQFSNEELLEDVEGERTITDKWNPSRWEVLHGRGSTYAEKKLAEYDEE